MNTPGALIYLTLVLAIVAANAPFVFERILFVRRSPAGRKAFGWRLLELTLLYLLVGFLARVLEGRQGVVYPQGWEFYAITYCLFLVFAYPGFVYRYMWRRD